jgi:hypothetical protein
MLRRQKSEYAKPEPADRRPVRLNPAFIKNLSGGAGRLADNEVDILKNVCRITRIAFARRFRLEK